jgi:hypothetical protein
MTEVNITMNAAAVGCIAAMNCVLDALVTAHPDLAAAIALRLQAKRAELLASPETEHGAAAPVMDMLLHDLERSARALQRSTPKGQA